MATLRRRHVGLATVVLTFLLSSISPAGSPASAQEAGPDPDSLARVAAGTSGLEAVERIDGDKAPTQQPGPERSGPAATAPTPARPGHDQARLRLDRHLPGGVAGLAATSPAVTGTELTGATPPPSRRTRPTSPASERGDRRRRHAGRARGADRPELPHGVRRRRRRRPGQPGRGDPRHRRRRRRAARTRCAQPLTDSSPDVPRRRPRSTASSAATAERRRGRHLRQPRHRHLAGAPVVRRPGQPGRAAARPPARECNFGDNPLTPAVDVVRVPEQADRRRPLHRRPTTPSRATTRYAGHGPRR